MENYNEKIDEAFAIVTSKQNVRIVGTKYKFYAYQFVSKQDGKFYISYNYKSYPKDNYYTAGCCEADLATFKRVVDNIFLDKQITVSIKDQKEKKDELY